MLQELHNSYIRVYCDKWGNAADTPFTFLELEIMELALSFQAVVFWVFLKLIWDVSWVGAVTFGTIGKFPNPTLGFSSKNRFFHLFLSRYSLHVFVAQFKLRVIVLKNAAIFRSFDISSFLPNFRYN